MIEFISPMKFKKLALCDSGGGRIFEWITKSTAQLI